MAARDRSLTLLPPRPKVRNWIAASLSAGTTLAIAELGVCLPGDLLPPPPLGFALLAIDVVAVGVFGGLIGWVLRAAGVRLTHSGMVGALLAPLLGVTLLGAITSRLWFVGPPTALGASGLTAALLFAIAAGVTAARLGERLEHSGVVLAGPLVWAACAFPLAAAARILHFGLDGPLAWAALLGLPSAAVLLVVLAVERSRRRETRRVAGPLQPLAQLLTLAVGLVVWPWIAPWIFYEKATPATAGAPPSILVIALEDVPASPGDDATVESASEALELIEAGGVMYERWRGRGPAGVESLLATPGGGSVAEQLAGRGYAAGAILTVNELAGGVAPRDVDARPGPRGLLAGPLAWTSGASLLRSLGPAWLARLHFDGAVRSPRELTEVAKQWLVHWRSLRAPAPFFLLVDFRRHGRHAESLAGVVASYGELQEILEHLAMLEVAEQTAILASLDSAPGAQPQLRAVLRLPAALGSVERAAGPVYPEQIGAALLEIAQSDQKEIRLPGLDGRP